jgi:hypothetical protein
MNAMAMLAEPRPATATETLLAAQMIGTQRLAMVFLARATIDGQTIVGCNANILGATRLMRLFSAKTRAWDTISRTKTVSTSVAPLGEKQLRAAPRFGQRAHRAEDHVTRTGLYTLP